MTIYAYVNEVYSKCYMYGLINIAGYVDAMYNIFEYYNPVPGQIGIYTTQKGFTDFWESELKNFSTGVFSRDGGFSRTGSITYTNCTNQISPTPKNTFGNNGAMNL